MMKLTGFPARSIFRTLHVRITKNRMQIRHIESGSEIALDAAQPFTNSRLLVADFSAAQRLLKQGIAEAAGRYGLAPVIVVHPAEMMEGGLSESDERLLLELGYGTGARHVAVVPEALSDAEVRPVAKGRHPLSPALSREGRGNSETSASGNKVKRATNWSPVCFSYAQISQE